MKPRVLLISCTCPSPSTPSLGVSSIATYLLSNGAEVKIFDDGPYMLDIQDTLSDPREKILLVQKTDKRTLLRIPYGDRFSDLLELVDEFKPDLVGVSSTEVTFNNAIEYLDKIKERAPSIKTAIGGPFAILAPEIAISRSSVDMVAFGEGEYALEEYCHRLMTNKDPMESKGFWVKSPGGQIRKNSPQTLVDINNIAPLRFDLYSPKRFLRPISGAVRRIFPLEVSRGCVYNCTFCASPEFRLRLRGGGEWQRNKKIAKIDTDISTYITLYDPEYFFIISETFLTMQASYLDAFVDMYNKYRIPFWMNTRPETIKDEYIKKLKDIGLERMSIGVECGNEKYRKAILNRRYSNAFLEKAFGICRKYDIKVTANVMIGLPEETREMIFESIRLMRALKPTSLGLCIFQPFKGTRLYQYSVNKKYCDPSNIISTTVYTPNMANNKLPSEELIKLLYTFNLYVKMDETDWPLIDSIDFNTDSGTALFRHLTAQCSDSEAVK